MLKRILLVVGGCLLLTAVLVAWRLQAVRAKQAGWVADCLQVVEESLRSGTDIPAEMKARLGEFQRLEGEDFAGAVWNIQGYGYLIADRDAHFSGGIIPVRVYATEGRVTNPGVSQVTIKSVEQDGQLYRVTGPLPRTMVEGLRFMVSHPDLKDL